MTDNSLTMKKCPVCGESYFVKSLELHITKMAGREAMRQMVTMVRHSGMKPYTFSPLIVLRNCKHWAYRRKHKQKFPINPLEL